MSLLVYVQKIMHVLVNTITVLLLCIVGGYSAYALWDNSQVYAAVDLVQEKLLWLRPKPETGNNEPSFKELQVINPDVCAWLTLDGTGIDHPVLHGKNNFTYLNTDVYGDFSLAGSIFLASECEKDFSENYALLYGHHMDNGRMFGDLDLYKNESFFAKYGSGCLMLPDRTYELEIFACLVVPSSEETVFNPRQWQADIDGLLDFVSGEAMCLKQYVVDELRMSEQPQIIAMTTCASEFTDARTVVMAEMKPQEDENAKKTDGL